jgi:hypothetical protein
MACRPDSPYTDDTTCPYPEGFEGYTSEVCWMAQNEGQRVYSVGLHFPPREDLDE